VSVAPTFAAVSVKLFRVVLFPEDGLPTSPIKGSRGIVEVYEWCFLCVLLADCLHAVEMSYTDPQSLTSSL